MYNQTIKKFILKIQMVILKTIVQNQLEKLKLKNKSSNKVNKRLGLLNYYPYL
jgi:hypothetical protein